MSSSALSPAAAAFCGVLKFNTVFVYDADYLSLRAKGYGARVVYGADASPEVATEGAASAPHSTRGASPPTLGDGGILESVAYEQVRGSADPSSPVEAVRGDTAYTVGNPSLALTKQKVLLAKACAIAVEEDYMVLMDEEAFYLYSEKLLVITVNTPGGAPIPGEEYLWSKFYEKNHKFPLKYTTFKFFRDQKYCVKTGCNFGMDYAIYRSNPNRSHSELCAIVIDATALEDTGEGRDCDVETDTDADGDSSRCQLGWRHVSTLTRVMPDVMKQMLMCYVLRSAASSSSCAERIDYSSSACVRQLQVRPVTTHIRRQFVTEKNYMTVRAVQTKIRAGSVLKMPRKEGNMKSKKKKAKKRRDPEEVRAKAQSKHGKLWSALARPLGGGGGGGGEGSEEKLGGVIVNKKQEKRRKEQQSRDGKRLRVAGSSEVEDAEPAEGVKVEAAAAHARLPEVHGNELLAGSGENNIFAMDFQVVEPTKIPSPLREIRRSHRLSLAREGDKVL